MRRFLFSLAPLLGLTGNIAVLPISFDGAGLVRPFNELKGSPRLIGIFSPTCGHCLQTCHELQELLEEYPKANLRILLLWAPFQEGDNIAVAGRAAETYLFDSRVTHLWDVWKFGSRSYSDRFRLVVENAWGIVMFFEPGATWSDAPPEPEFWLQSRNLRVGTPFSKKGLERKLRDWLAGAGDP